MNALFLNIFPSNLKIKQIELGYTRGSFEGFSWIVVQVNLHLHIKTLTHKHTHRWVYWWHKAASRKELTEEEQNGFMLALEQMSQITDNLSNQQHTHHSIWLAYWLERNTRGRACLLPAARGQKQHQSQFAEARSELQHHHHHGHQAIDNYLNSYANCTRPQGREETGKCTWSGKKASSKMKASGLYWFVSCTLFISEPFGWLVC